MYACITCIGDKLDAMLPMTCPEASQLITDEKEKEKPEKKDGMGNPISEGQVKYIKSMCLKLGKQDLFDKFMASNPTVAMACEIIEKLKSLVAAMPKNSGWKKYGKK